MTPPEHKSRRLFEFLFPFAVIGLLWELAARTGVLPAASVPPPSVIVGRAWSLSWDSGALPRHLGASLYRLTIGYSLAVAAGVAIGALLAIQGTIRQMVAPVLSLLVSVPTIAWVPVLLITLGLGDRTVITSIFLGGFFAIAYNTMRGVEMVDRSQVNAARLMGLGGIRLFLSVLLPGALVSIITGLRLGIGYSWRALVGGEMLSALVEWGIGKMIYQARFWNDIAVMFVGLVVIGLSGVALDRLLLISLEERTVQRWGMLDRR
jgi:NitT/TauT family transport system permease protein